MANTRRRKPRPVLTGLAVILCLLAGYASLIEPYWIEVTRHHLSAPIHSPLKLAHITDLHTHGMGRRERQLLTILEAERPDLIVITGDTIPSGGTYERCRQVLRQLRAPLGVWLVRGNWENGQPTSEDQALYDAIGVRMLVNTGAPLRDDVWVVGLDDAWTGTPNLDAALANIPAGIFTIALFHSPMFFQQTAGRCRLSLAGHSHGGQVRLPGVKPFWLPQGVGPFLEGWYEANGSRLYVSRGLGTSVLPLRFFCRPEVALITLEPET